MKQVGWVLISDLNGANTKTDFRVYLKERLRLFVANSAGKSSAESRITNQLLPILSNVSGTVAVFSGLMDEPNLANLYSSLGVPLCFPDISGQEMRFLSVPNYSQADWADSSLGFRYPASGALVSTSEIHAVLVPGLGFSAFGERLGRGKGFYDQYLSNFKGLKIGICFDCQWTDDHLPVDSWDIKMDIIITESKCVEVKD